MNFLQIDFRNIGYFNGNVEYLHNGKNIGSGAFDITCRAEIVAHIPRAVGIRGAEIEIFDESLTSLKARMTMAWRKSDMKNDAYVAKLDLSALGVGLYYFRLKLESACGELFGMLSCGKLVFSTELGKFDHFQMSIVDFLYDEPKNYYGGVIYHIFVDRFNRCKFTNTRADAVICEDWDEGIPDYPEYPGAHLENNNFYGGTLWGVIEKLDYIKSLGVNLIYLSPIFEAYSNHKYDTGDYMKVDEMFGGEEALVHLIAEAKKRGIGIILDGVFNHTGADSVYFNKFGKYSALGAYQSKESLYYSWYDFQEYPNKYTCWWDIEILPRINPDKKECRSYFTGAGGVIEKYTKLGIAGFRLDVADELSDDFIFDIKSVMSKYNKNNLLYGEVWEDASNKIAYGKRKTYYLGAELDGVMNYPLRDGVVDFLRNKNPDKLKYALTDIVFNAPRRIANMQMNLLGTHDTERIITALAGEESVGYSNAQLSTMKLSEEQSAVGTKLIKQAYTIVATAPGIPAIFYGDEIGMEGYHDPFNRRPYPKTRGNEEIRSHYIKIGKIRGKEDVYRDGDFKLIRIDKDILVFSRTKNKNVCYTFVNNSSKNLQIEFSKAGGELLSGIESRSYSFPKGESLIIKTTTNNKFEII